MHGVLDFSEVLDLKRAVMDGSGIYLHFHDACGGQYFEFDEPVDASMQQLIDGYLAPMGLRTVFAPDWLTFTLGPAGQ